MKQPTQVERIKNHLLTYGKISDNDARDMYGVHRLGARIYDLRQQGIEVITDMKTVLNRYGRKVQYAEYSIKKEKE